MFSVTWRSGDALLQEFELCKTISWESKGTLISPFTMLRHCCCHAIISLIFDIPTCAPTYPPGTQWTCTTWAIFPTCLLGTQCTRPFSCCDGFRRFLSNLPYITPRHPMDTSCVYTRPFFCCNEFHRFFYSVRVFHLLQPLIQKIWGDVSFLGYTSYDSW